MQLHPVKHLSKYLAVLAGLSIVSVILAVIGWVDISRYQPLAFTDLVFRSLKSFEAGGAYDDVGTRYKGEIFLEIARYLGVIVAFSSVGLFVTTQVSDRLIRFTVRLKKRHIILVGRSHFAEVLSAAFRSDVVHLTSAEIPPHQSGFLTRLPLRADHLHALSDVAAGKASSLVFAPDGDDGAIGLAMSAVNRFPGQEVYVRVADPWLAQRLHKVDGAERLRAFSEAGMAAREISRRHPLFLLARDLNQTCIHALLAGDHAWSEALMCEIVADCVTLTFGKPVISFICDNASAFEQRLKMRYPELDQSVDFHFYEAGQLTRVQAFDDTLERIGAVAPVTAVYITQQERGDVLTTSLTFLEQACKASNFQAPVFVLSDNAQGLSRPAPGAALTPLQLVPFGAAEDFVHALGIGRNDVHQAERQYHEEYLRIAVSPSEAAVPWTQLKEEYRVSNARAVGHIYAKLFEAGFNLRDWMAGHNIWTELPALKTGERLWRNAAERTRLAELEHLRWMMDRRLNGWSQGPRDALRKFHPDLIPFEVLSEDVRNNDYAFIDLLDRLLERLPDGMSR